MFELFFDADLIIAASSRYQSLEQKETAYRAKKLVARLDYSHFVQFSKELEKMSLEEFDDLRMKFGFSGCWELVEQI